MSHSKTPLALVPLFLALTACSSQTAAPDAGGGGGDGGMPPEDAADPSDARTAPADAGEPPRDARPVDEDAGTEEEDGGAPGPAEGIWLSREEILALPMSGDAWENVLDEANASAGTPDLSDQNQTNNVRILARALVWARTGEERYRTEVREACMDAMETENGGRTLALGRELLAYVIAADIVGLEPDEDDAFRAWLQDVRHETLSGRTLVSTHEDRPNNWGTHAGASRIAVAAYLGDTDDLARAADVFRGWLGERSAYDEFDYGDDLSWQCDPDVPVGINPVGCTKDGHSIDGVIPDDQRRGGSFDWPLPRENYVWEALQGAVVQAQLLARRGYDAWEWGDRALLRAVSWLHEEAGYPAEGDDTWTPWLVNAAYGTSFPAPSPTQAGKNIGFTDWTHASP